MNSLKIDNLKQQDCYPKILNDNQDLESNRTQYQDQKLVDMQFSSQSFYTQSTIQTKQSNIFTKASQRRQIILNQPEELKQEIVLKSQIEVKQTQSNVEELRNVIAKHIFINKWYQGPYTDKSNENYFIRDDKIVIIEDDEDAGKQDRLEEGDEILGGLVQQHINPTDYVLGDKQEILEKMKAEEVRISKIKKENETKKFIQNSDVKMTIYPAYDNFFKKQV